MFKEPSLLGLTPPGGANRTPPGGGGNPPIVLGLGFETASPSLF